MADVAPPCQLKVPLPSLSRAPAGWAGLPISLEGLPAEHEVLDYVAPYPSLAVVLSGSGKRWFTTEGRTHALHSAAGMCETYEAGYAVDARWSGRAGEVIQIQIPPNAVENLLLDDRPFRLHTRYEMFDNRLAEIVRALWQQASRFPSDDLYVQELTLELLRVLDALCGTGSHTSRQSVGKFQSRDMQRLRSIIEERLCGDLRIEQLASSLSISPQHFARMFKASFGQTPHSFVLNRRIEAACRTLRSQPDRPIADIASDFGFASQAHLTETFRRNVGTTPARWRCDA